MIVCPYCQRELLEGTVFCPECGGSLLPQEELAEEPEPREVRDAGTVPAGEPSAPPKTTARITAAQLRLLVLNSGRTISCPMQEVVLIGRSDLAGGIFPDVDLTQDNGYMAGVSRRHARIICRGNDFFLEDLESVNGTYLNRRKLAPHTLVPFHDGDEIRLGNLVLRVILEAVGP